MQVRLGLILIGFFLALAGLQLAPSKAGEYSEVEIGHKGTVLENSALDQPKHYVGHESDLLERIECLLADVDKLLVRLHAKQPEIWMTDPLRAPVDEELGRLFKLGLANAPELRAPRSELAVLAARTRQASAPPDPMVGLELMNLGTPFGPLTSTDGLGFRVTIGQDFITAGKLELESGITSREEDLKELELAQMELELLLKLTEEYYSLFGQTVRLRALDDNVTLLQLLLELGERRLATGSIPQAEVLSAQVQLSELELMRIELRAEIIKSWERLYGLLGRPAGLGPEDLKFDAPYPLPSNVVIDIDCITAEGLARYPMYAMAEVQQEQQELELKLAQREYTPDYRLMGEYELGIGEQDRIMLGVEFPLFLHKKQRQDAKVQEEYAEFAPIIDQRDTVANAYQTLLREFVAELEMHGRLVDLYREGSVPQARLALESNIASFAAGMMDFRDLIMSQQMLLDQEQELEQNYIHILHTLTDLHVLTLGAFDPTPHLIPAELPVEATARPIVMLTPGAVADRVSSYTELSAHDLIHENELSIGGPLDAVRPLQPLPLAEVWVEDGSPLMLPELAEENAEKQPGSPGESEAPTDEFYAPFTPAEVQHD